jgi:hypothetical protein
MDPSTCDAGDTVEPKVSAAAYFKFQSISYIANPLHHFQIITFKYMFLEIILAVLRMSVRPFSLLTGTKYS